MLRLSDLLFDSQLSSELLFGWIKILGISVITASTRPLMPAFKSSLAPSELCPLESKAKSIAVCLTVNVNLLETLHCMVWELRYHIGRFPVTSEL
ncbi:uncharacterized protein J3R85_001644 [Psidium guajava]|nr:uncharacterized protein J3R85_001644 [Psidium guajava]